MGIGVAGLKSPFGIVIDAQNRVWGSNSQSETLMQLPADNPSKVEAFRSSAWDIRVIPRLGWWTIATLAINRCRSKAKLSRYLDTPGKEKASVAPLPRRKRADYAGLGHLSPCG
jgi:hypothetical protein